MRLILGKLVRLLVVIWFVTLASFLLTKGLGGNNDLVTKLIPFGSEQTKAQVRQDLGLNDPLITQYGHWLGNFVQGDLGNTYLSTGGREPVSNTLSNALPVSLELMLYVQVLTLLIAIPVGVLTAYRAGSFFDRSANIVGFALVALPNLVVAFLLAAYVGAKWKLLPTQSNLVPFPLNPLDNWRYMLMPTVSLALGQIAIYMRLLRSDMVATLQEDFITTAKAKGISARRVLFRHALRPSSLTLLTVAGLNVGALISGAIVIEKIFGLPGIGGQLVASIYGQQLVAAQSYIAVIAIFYVVLNFIVDLLYSVLDPRIRHARAIA
jgi:peptide/nickel transport system permease protein